MLGKVREVIGPVVDIEFPPGDLPQIYHAVTIDSDGSKEDREVHVTLETMQHLGTT